MKKSRVKNYLVLVGLALMLCACKKEPTWQDQYDLGMKYLEEGNYEEAIAAFSAAIEIDAVPVEAHKELSNALYLSVGETDEQELNDDQRALCEQARDAYLWLIESGNAGADEYIKAAEMNEKLGDLDAALEIINRGIENVEDEKLTQKRRELEKESMRSKSYDAVIFENYDPVPVGYDSALAYGIDFSEPIKGLIDGQLVQVDITNICQADGIQIAPIKGKKVKVYGYLQIADVETGCYIPNGEYQFCVEGYEIVE